MEVNPNFSSEVSSEDAVQQAQTPNPESPVCPAPDTSSSEPRVPRVALSDDTVVPETSLETEGSYVPATPTSGPSAAAVLLAGEVSGGAPVRILFPGEGSGGVPAPILVPGDGGESGGVLAPILVPGDGGGSGGAPAPILFPGEGSGGVPAPILVPGYDGGSGGAPAPILVPADGEGSGVLPAPILFPGVGEGSGVHPAEDSSGSPNSPGPDEAIPAHYSSDEGSGTGPIVEDARAIGDDAGAIGDDAGTAIPPAVAHDVFPPGGTTDIPNIEEVDSVATSFIAVIKNEFSFRGENDSQLFSELGHEAVRYFYNSLVKRGPARGILPPLPPGVGTSESAGVGEVAAGVGTGSGGVGAEVAETEVGAEVAEVGAVVGTGSAEVAEVAETEGGESPFKKLKK